MARIHRRRPLQRPELSLTRGPQPAAGLVVVLHGGPERGFAPTRRWSAPYLRMWPFGAAIREASAERIAVIRVRHQHTGWNGGEETTLGEASLLLDEIAARAPWLPVGLLGHSLGGRTALRAAGHPAVRSVVALAPWVPEGESVEQLAGRAVLVVQGSRDLVCPVADTDAYVQRAREVGSDITYERLHGCGHLMIRRAEYWHSLAARHLCTTLLSNPA
ncbi:alpha/beta hydrolase [Gephyromycinifex aptenodytis]|uniref:alpha/beta hydrolase n=1 Tax=Gephyromycinifex aptenodytis TaxID=2716227 RepID=UPI0014474A27|nr:alpha/beta fold hydrolase [Gephyromycinifex aptenodytis]